MSELRDVEAIRNGIAREVYARSPRRSNAYRCADDIIAKFVEPLLSALAAEKARADEAEHMRDTYYRSSMAYRNELRIAREQVADRDAKLAAVEALRDEWLAWFGSMPVDNMGRALAAALSLSQQ